MRPSEVSSPQIIRLQGEYDLTRRDELAALFGSLGEGALVIDMSGVTYVDSSALSELAALRSRSAERQISLVGVNDHIRRIFDIVSFHQIFDIAE